MKNVYKMGNANSFGKMITFEFMVNQWFDVLSSAGARLVSLRLWFFQNYLLSFVGIVASDLVMNLWNASSTS